MAVTEQSVLDHDDIGTDTTDCDKNNASSRGDEIIIKEDESSADVVKFLGDVAADESVKLLYDDYNGRLEKQHNAKMRVEPIDILKDVPDDQKHLVKEAGQGGAVVGFVLGGPIGSALMGFGSAYAVRKDNPTGKVAKKIAECTIRVKQKANQFEDRHRFYEKSVTTVNRICGDDVHGKPKNDNSYNYNEEEEEENGTYYGNSNSYNNKEEVENERPRNIAHKTRRVVRSGWNTAAKFTNDNQLIERGVEGTGKGMEFVGDTINKIKHKIKNCKKPTVFGTNFPTTTEAAASSLPSPSKSSIQQQQSENDNEYDNLQLVINENDESEQEKERFEKENTKLVIATTD